MEIPIRIVVAFVVILAVGTTIIMISNDMLKDTSDRVKDIGKTASKDKIIEKSSFGSDEVLFLAQQCYDNSFGITTEDLCYILKSTSAITLPTATATITIASGASTTSKTLYISFKHDSTTGAIVTISD